MASSSSGPPIIDVSPIIKAFEQSNNNHLDESASEEVKETIAAVRDACSQWGFFQCINHGISETVMNKFDFEARRFFAQPIPFKTGIKRTANNSRGWFNDELTKQKRDWKEGMDIGQPGWSKVDGENQWPTPSELPQFRPAMEEYYAACWSLSRTLLRACAVGLGMSPNHFDTEAEPHTSYLRLNYYPVCDQKVAAPTHGFGEPDPEQDGNLGINKHSDAGCLTVLRQYTNQPASLQVFHQKEQKWYRVVPVEGALTINIGDMMQVWSNGLYQAPVHRVLANAERVRYSAPFFYNPSHTSNIEPVATAGTPRYHPLNWGEFRRRRFEGDFGDDAEDVQISDWLIHGGKYGQPNNNNNQHQPTKSHL